MHENADAKPKPVLRLIHEVARVGQRTGVEVAVWPDVETRPTLRPPDAAVARWGTKPTRCQSRNVSRGVPKSSTPPRRSGVRPSTARTSRPSGFTVRSRWTTCASSCANGASDAIRPQCRRPPAR
mgnify:CR=1 FL=1